MATLVYQYGLLPPTSEAARIDEQMKLAHRYRNRLVEIERGRRERVADALAAHEDVGPLIAERDALLALRSAARQEIKDARAKARRRAETKEQRAKVLEIEARLQEARQRVKDAWQAVAQDPGIQRTLAFIADSAREQIRDARGSCNVYWGTYLLQEAAMDMARRSKSIPQFSPYRGEGRVSVQINGGLKVEDLWGGDTLIQIDPVDPALAYDHPTRGVRRRASRTRLRLRVGSLDRAPIWGEWPMIMHRPLPEGAVIKVATVSRRRRNSQQWEWRLDLTVVVPDGYRRRKVPDGGAVALNLGFCLLPEGIRSGYVVGDDGYQQEIRVAKSDLLRGRDLTAEQIAKANAWVTHGVSKASSIRSFRDTAMDAIRARLLSWRQAWHEQHQAEFEATVAQVNASRTGSGDPRLDSKDGWLRLVDYIGLKGPALPAWLLERLRYVHAWRSPQRFSALAAMWRGHRFPGDEEILAELEAWRERDVHLECYESGLRTSALRDRKEGYRILASRLAAKYRWLLVDDTNLSEFQRSPAPEDERVELAAVKQQQRLAAGSELRSSLMNAFGPGRTWKTSSKDVTRKCNACGALNARDPDGSRLVRCTGCSATWDQDANACLNIIRAWRIDHEQGGAAAPVDKPPPRSVRLREAKVVLRKRATEIQPSK